MARLIAALIRHGDYHQLADTPSAHQPFPLTARGRAQAEQAAVKLQQQSEEQGWKIALELHSSRLLRAWETADLIARQLGNGYHVVEYADLAERGMGSASNLSIRQIEEIVRQDPRFEGLPEDWKSNSHYCLPLQGAESLVQAGQRVAKHLIESMQHLGNNADTDTVKVFVGHGAAIRHAAYELGVLNFEEIAQLSMYHAEPVYIEYGKRGWKHVAGNWKIRGNATELD